MDPFNPRTPIYTHSSNGGSDDGFNDLMNRDAEVVVLSSGAMPKRPALDSSSPTAGRSSNLDSGNEDAPLRTWNSVDSQINASPVRGEHEGDEGVAIRQPIALPKKKFTQAEDEALISAFISVLTDISVSTNQRKEPFWSKIKTLYDEARKSNPTEIRERSTGMLNNRFRRISSGVMKFVGCYDEANRQRQSGMNEEDVFKCALDLYGENFQFENCWLLLKNYPKYKEVIAAYVNNKSQPQDDFRTPNQNLPAPIHHCYVVTNGRGKRTRPNEGVISTDFDGGEGASVSTRRPEGVKPAKKRKCKGKVGMESLGQLSESLTNLAKNMIDPKYFWEKLNFSKSKEAARRAEKQAELDLKRQEIETESRNMNMQLLHSLLQKDSLDERMEKLKNGLLKELGF